MHTKTPTNVPLLTDPVASGRRLQAQFRTLFDTRMFLSALYEIDRASDDGLPMGLAAALQAVTDDMERATQEIQDMIGYDPVCETLGGVSFNVEEERQ